LLDHKKYAVIFNVLVMPVIISLGGACIV